MKKIYLAGLLLPFSLIATMHYFAGTMIASNYKNTIDLINEKQDIKVDLISYRRGILQSIAQIDVIIPSEDEAQPNIINLNQYINHGPIILTANDKLQQFKFLAAAIDTHIGERSLNLVNTLTNNNKPLDIKTNIDFKGKATTAINTIPLDQTSDNELRFIWGGLHASLTHNLDWSKYKGTIAVPHFSLGKYGKKLKIENLTVKLDTEIVNDKVVGQNTFTAQNIEYIKLRKKIMSFQNPGVTINTTLGEEDESVDLHIRAHSDFSRIVRQYFPQNKIDIKVTNFKSENFRNLSKIHSLDYAFASSVLNELNTDNSKVKMQLPKHFTEALVAYFGLQFYKATPAGKEDHQDALKILDTIAKGVNNQINQALQKDILSDHGTFYELNLAFARDNPVDIGLK